MRDRRKAHVMIAVAALVLSVLAPCMALAERPVLLVSLPQDAQMVENVEFEDGDFVQTYQLSGGAYVQLLRYAGFDMTVDDLLGSEWIGAQDVQDLSIAKIGGFDTTGVRLSCTQDGQDAVIVTLVLVVVGSDTLVYQAVYPQSIGAEQIASVVDDMIHSMDVLGGEGNGVQMPEVG